MLFLLLMVWILASCQEDRGKGNDVIPAQPAVFTSTVGVGSSAMSRAFNNQWEEGDRVGIYMIDPGTLPALSLSQDAGGEALSFTNIPYVAGTGGESTDLEAADASITFPTTGEDMNFIAYYPYTDEIDITNPANPIYKVNVTTQDPQTAIDLIYHNGTLVDGYTPGDHDYNKDNEEVALNFSHQLSKLNFCIVRNPSTETEFTPKETTYTSRLVGFPRQADYSLATGALSGAADASTSDSPLIPVFDTERSNAEMLIFEAIVVPHTAEAFSERTFSITIDDTAYDYTFPADRAFNPGEQYTYNFRISGSRLVLVGSTLVDWLGGTMVFGDYMLNIDKESFSETYTAKTGLTFTMRTNAPLAPELIASESAEEPTETPPSWIKNINVSIEKTNQILQIM